MIWCNTYLSGAVQVLKIVHIMIQCNVQYVKKISKISWCELISLNHKIDCCICSSGSRAFPAGFVQQNLPRLNFVGSSHFFNFTYFFFPEEDNFPLSGKLCDVSNFQLRLHQREFKMVVPPSKVSNFFQRKEISQKLEAFFHSVSSYHRPIIKFPLTKMILNECAARVDYENRKSTDLQQVS